MRYTQKAMATAMLSTVFISGVMASPASADATPETVGPSIVDAPSSTLGDRVEWTPEMMLEAQPGDDHIIADESKLSREAEQHTNPSARASTPVEFVAPVEPLVPIENVVVDGTTYPATVGKLFAILPNGDPQFCTASVVNSNGKNMLYTAAHCVYNKEPDHGADGWNTSISFAPAYYQANINGNRFPVLPFNMWEINEASVYAEWTEGHDRAYDQAFLSTKTFNNKNIVDVVGGNAMSYGNSNEFGFTTLWGYPVVGFYKNMPGPFSCFVAHSPSDAITGGIRSTCDMTGGSSGGPWYKSMIDKNKGEIIATISGRAPFGTPGGGYMHGSMNTEHTKTLYTHREQNDS